MIWDRGKYSPEVEIEKGVRRTIANRSEGEEVAQAGLRDGNLKFILFGSKLHGSFALVRTRMFGSTKEAWLLIKHRDGHCKSGFDANNYDLSAVSGRSLAEIAAAG